MEHVYLVRDSEGILKDTELYNNDFQGDWRESEYLRNAMKGKMINIFGGDAFSKGYIEVINLKDHTVTRIESYKQLREGN